MTTATAPALTLILTVDLCDARRQIEVRFDGTAEQIDRNAAAYVKSHGDRYAMHIDPDDDAYSRYPMPLLTDALFPLCEHGMDAVSCSGPGHFYFDEEERAYGLAY